MFHDKFVLYFNTILQAVISIVKYARAARSQGGAITLQEHVSFRCYCMHVALKPVRQMAEAEDAQLRSEHLRALDSLFF